MAVKNYHPVFEFQTYSLDMRARLAAAIVGSMVQNSINYDMPAAPPDVSPGRRQAAVQGWVKENSAELGAFMVAAADLQGGTVKPGQVVGQFEALASDALATVPIHQG